MSPGWYALQRGWMENAAFKKPFSDGQVYVWSMERAAWAPCDVQFNGRVCHLERGQLITSQREMAAIFGWGEMAIRGVLKRFSKARFWTHQTTHAGTLITVCNYEDIQPDARDKEHTKQRTPNAPVTHLLEEEKEEEEKKKGNGGAAAHDDPPSHYAFEGCVIKLTSASLEKWRAAFPNVHNLEGELVARDAWLATQPAKDRGNWFHSTAARLAKLDREMDLAERAEDRAEGSMKRPWIV